MKNEYKSKNYKKLFFLINNINIIIRFEKVFTILGYLSDL